MTHCASPQGTRLVTGCEDHVVRLFDLNKEENAMTAILTRFQSPVRAVAFNVTGSTCAAAGEYVAQALAPLPAVHCLYSACPS